MWMNKTAPPSGGSLADFINLNQVNFEKKSFEPFLRTFLLEKLSEQFSDLPIVLCEKEAIAYSFIKLV